MPSYLFQTFHLTKFKMPSPPNMNQMIVVLIKYPGRIKSPTGTHRDRLDMANISVRPNDDPPFRESDFHAHGRA
jgi:hypothetical protein